LLSSHLPIGLSNGLFPSGFFTNMLYACFMSFHHIHLTTSTRQWPLPLHHFPSIITTDCYVLAHKETGNCFHTVPPVQVQPVVSTILTQAFGEDKHAIFRQNIMTYKCHSIVHSWYTVLVRTLAASHGIFLYLCRHSVGLLWTSDQSVAKASTYTEQHKGEDKYPCFEPDSNPWSQRPSLRLRPRGHWDWLQWS
jgi:hypothetical protein